MGRCFEFGNRWWDGGPWAVTKKLTKRTVWSCWNAGRKAKEPMTFIPLGIGLLLVFFAAWLVIVANKGESYCDDILRALDDAIDYFIEGANYLTQDLPNDTTKFLTDTIEATQNTLNNILDVATKNIASGANYLSDATEDAINEAIKWAKDQTGGAVNVDKVNIPGINVNNPGLGVWQPDIPNLDLSYLEIPPRSFSIYKEMNPFVNEAFDIARLVAYYLLIIGIVLLTYFSAIMCRAGTKACCPTCKCCPDSRGGVVCELCMACTKNTASGTVNVVEVFLRPWIHVPFIVGIILIVVVYVYLMLGIDYIERQINIPLKETDDAIRYIIGEFNEVVEDVPADINDFLVDQQDAIYTAASRSLDQSFDSILGFMNSIVGDVEDGINWVLDEMGADDINIPSFRRAQLGLTIPEQLIPYIPELDLSYLELPEDLIEVQATIGPWVHDQLNEVRKVAWYILVVGIVLVVVPGSVMFAHFIKPFIPRSVKDWFQRPDWMETDYLPKETTPMNAGTDLHTFDDKDVTS
mmetsp:Transcript_3021/g.4094  ORF Transcript_3021/g.4094 Transcript_3021/m.4094 type:complete len:523 (+) Transcript_3021:92-1660(+)